MKILKTYEDYVKYGQCSVGQLHSVKILFDEGYSPDFINACTKDDATENGILSRRNIIKDLPEQIIKTLSAKYFTSTSLDAVVQMYKETGNVSKSMSMCGSFDQYQINAMFKLSELLSDDDFGDMASKEYNPSTMDGIQSVLEMNLPYHIAEKAVKIHSYSFILLPILKEWVSDENIPLDFIDYALTSIISQNSFISGQNIRMMSESFKRFKDFDLFKILSNKKPVVAVNELSKAYEILSPNQFLKLLENTDDLLPNKIQLIAKAIQDDFDDNKMSVIVDISKLTTNNDIVNEFYRYCKDDIYTDKELLVLAYIVKTFTALPVEAFINIENAHERGLCIDEILGMMYYGDKEITAIDEDYVKLVCEIALSGYPTDEKEKYINIFKETLLSFSVKNKPYMHPSELVDLASMLVRGYTAGYSDSQMKFCRSKKFTCEQIEQIYKGFDSHLSLVEIKKYAKPAYNEYAMSALRHVVENKCTDAVFKLTQSMINKIISYDHTGNCAVYNAINKDIPPLIVKLALIAGKNTFNEANKEKIISLIMSDSIYPELIGITSIIPINTVFEAQTVLNSVLAKYNTMSFPIPESSIVFNLPPEILVENLIQPDDIDISDYLEEYSGANNKDVKFNINTLEL